MQTAKEGHITRKQQLGENVQNNNHTTTLCYEDTQQPISIEDSRGHQNDIYDMQGVVNND